MVESRQLTKVLIANRGEIAVRIIRACRELGVRTVAVYSDVDREALHVRYANTAYYIGAPPPRDSYLNIGKIIDVARQSGADAIHPGYGFLAERDDFAEACRDAGIIFIGPTPEAMRIMGDKQAARKTVAEAGVPIVPGTEQGLSDEELIRASEKIGFPVMIKAAAGGGGKGMRQIDRVEDMPDALAAAHREAEGAFGDGTVYLEKRVENARHIEIQILADMHGNVMSLGERECSIQRRHQKLVEESPSPFLNEAMRQAMSEVAVKVARSVNYLNAGTVEFIVDKNRNFYFLEMNTRLQVEHAVTELVTGIDMVKEQLRIARGRRMEPTPETLQMRGHAIECRINAEDPYNNFLPSVGKISMYHTPTGPGVRLDSGMYTGWEISPYYDSLIAKLIVWGANRPQAIRRLSRALNEYRIMGLKTNLPFHQKLVDSHHFISGKFDTGFIEQYFDPAVDPKQLDPESAAIIATLVAHEQQRQASQIITPPERDTSNWKWIGRYERMHR